MKPVQLPPDHVRGLNFVLGDLIAARYSTLKTVAAK